MESQAQISPQEATALGEHDGAFFAEYFFPKTFRQTTPPILRSVWDELDNVNHRLSGTQIWRGGAKTTIFRGYTAKRISYGLLRTGMYVGKSEPHALRSLMWVMKQVEFNRLWSQTFGLMPGKPWNAEHCCIIHKVLEIEIHLVGVGIMGSTRGINIDDYRPDFILLDDVLDDDNTATPEQRKKVNERIFGAILNSLVPRSENPTAKLAMIQTPINRDDASELIQRDEQFHTIKVSCFDENGESRWPERWTTKELLEMKEGFKARNMLSLWLREMECKVVADEKRHFRFEWLNYWVVYPEHLTVCIAIDPSPPKDEDPEKRAKKDPDPEVVGAVARYGKNYYLLEYIVEDDPNPNKTIASVSFLVRKYNAMMLAVETVAYQKTVAWFLNNAMEEGKIPHMIISEIDDKRSKVKRIRHTFTQIAPQGNLYIKAGMEKFEEQFQDYPDVTHEDVLDMTAIGIQSLRDFGGITYDGEYDVEEEEQSLKGELTLDHYAP